MRIEDYAETLRGHRVLHLVGKGNKPATMPLTVPVLWVLEACRAERISGPLILRPLTGKPIDRRDVYRMTVDATATIDLIAALKRDRAWAGVRVTPLLLVAMALLLAVGRHPGINARLDESAGEIVQLSYVNLGIAVATPRGLLVPNVKEAHDLDQLGNLSDLDMSGHSHRVPDTPLPGLAR